MIKQLNYDKEKQKISFAIDMSLSLANAIRRSVLEIPIMAIDEVEIVKNDSALYDEMLAHRIGLIPIKTGKADKETKFKLKEKGPKTVCSGDLKPSIETNSKLPIVLLDEGQEIEIVADARLGKGIEHIKHSPGLIFYRHNLEPEILEFVYVDDAGRVSYDEEELSKISDEQKEKIKKIKEVKELVFEIESWGQIDVKEIFSKSIDVLNKNLDELNKAVK